MFNNKKCSRCGRKISRDYDFCPYCGNDFRMMKRMRKQEDFGLLGKDDFIDNFPNFGMENMPFGSIFNSLLKEVDKQFREMDRQMAKETSEKNVEKIKKQGGSGISISISTATGKKPEIKVSGFGPEFQSMEKEIKEVKIEKPNISDEQAMKFAKLPKKEAEASVRRLSNKVIYEIKLPGITSLNEILINKLENSVEIKAFTKNKVYFKLLPINLKIINYKLKGEILVIEFKA